MTLPDEMADARLDRIESHIERLASVTGELGREVRILVQGFGADRVVFRETLRELSGFVATAGIEMNQLGRQMQRLAEITESGFAATQAQLAENNRQIAENNRIIRRLLDILARGRVNGEGPPPPSP